MVESIEQEVYELKYRQKYLEDDFAQRMARMESMMEGLLAGAADNQEQLSQLICETKDLIALYKDIQSVGRIGIRVQKIMVWLAKWPLIGGGLYFIGQTMINYLKSKGWDL